MLSMGIAEVSYEDITRLNGENLVKLLDILLNNEVEKQSAKNVKRLSVPLPIYIKDGGEDARLEIEWDYAFESRWLKEKYTSFQSKASEMSETGCYSEILQKGTKTLKPKIQECFEKGGEYILFTHDTYTDQARDSREIKIREALKDAGKSYSDTAKIKIFDSNQIAEWCNQHIAAVIFVKEVNEKTLPLGFRTWELWNRTTSESLTFVYTEELKELSNGIIKNIAESKNLRVIGHSGIGKSRLIKETFNPKSDNPIAISLSRNLVYIDVATHGERELESFIINNTSMNGLLVVDNCRESTHLNLVGITHSNLKIITIDHSYQTSEMNHYIIKNDLQLKTVEEIFRNKFSAVLTPTEINKLVELSDGYPKMADHICKSIERDGIDKLDLNLPPEDRINTFIKKLIFGHEELDKTTFSIIKAASLFKQFGFIDDSLLSLADKGSIELVKQQHEVISSLVCIPSVTKQEFYATIVDLKRRMGILKQSRYSYYVVPEPLAANLAAEWITSFNPHEILPFAIKLKESGLLDPFCERLTSLNQISKAKSIVDFLLSEGSPFSTAEELNTDTGSRIFRSLVEVNPEASIKVLNKLYYCQPKDFLLKVDKGRKNLVWAIEKLCFRKEVFEDAAKILMGFAVAENETIANNATNQFYQLFHIYLPGTEADLSQRLIILNYGLQKNHDDYTILVINALGRGLKYDSFHRMGGAEKQGLARPLIDYQPTRNEIIDYWISIANILHSLARSHPSHLDLIKETIVFAVHPLLLCGQGELLTKIIKDVFSIDKKLWEKTIDKLKWERRNLEDASQILIIDSLLDFFAPKDLESQIILTITFPSYLSEIGTDGERIDLQQKNAEALAEEISKDVSLLYPYIQNILTGVQRQGFNFGKRLGEIIPFNEELVAKTVEALKRVEKPFQNVEFLCGLAFNATPLQKRSIIKLIESDKSIVQNIFYLTRVWLPHKEDVYNLFKYVDNKDFDVTIFDNFLYGRVLDSFSVEEVIELTERVYDYKEGKWTALGLIFQYAKEDKVKWPACIMLLKKMLSNYNYILNEGSIHSMNEYYWASTVEYILERTGEEEFAATISRQIFDFVFSNDINPSNDTFKNISNLLVKNYFDVFFITLLPALTTCGPANFNVKELLGSNSFGHDNVLFSIPGKYDMIFDFAKSFGVEMAEHFLSFMPTSVYVNGQYKLHPLVLRFLDEYGNNERIRIQIGSHLGRGGMISSMESYYGQQIILLNEITNHSNSNVRSWASKLVASLNKNIEKEKLLSDNSR